LLANERPINFGYLGVKAGSEAGARDYFEDLVANIVLRIRPGAIRLRGSGGDWGIDVVAGELLEGASAAIWQAKYFPERLPRNGRAQIEGAYAQALKKAQENGYRPASWTLCLPCRLTVGEKRWWDGFRRERMVADKLEIALLDESALAAHLYRPEFASLRRTFFDWSEPLTPLPLQELSDPAQFDQALFVAQLRHAGIPELNAAKREFFNAELLEREVIDKGKADEVEELTSRQIELLSLWETRFNARFLVPGDDLRALHPEVMLAADQHHGTSPLRALRAGMVHNRGLVHRHAEDRKLGWSRDWRKVADGYRS
jgi:hypothetical protein